MAARAARRARSRERRRPRSRQRPARCRISGGVIPCPTALVVLLAAISLHRVGYGLVLIVAFSLGLALTVTSIGLVAVTARRAFTRIGLDGPVVKALPALSALVVLALGVVMTARALPQLA